MKQILDMVKEFHIKYGVPILDKPSINPVRTLIRFNWLTEESDEYNNALWNENMIEVMDGLADILYVWAGTVLEHGLQDKMEEIFREVHRSNMTKEGGEGKMRKGKDYEKPELEKILE